MDSHIMFEIVMLRFKVIWFRKVYFEAKGEHGRLCIFFIPCKDTMKMPFPFLFQAANILYVMD